MNLNPHDVAKALGSSLTPQTAYGRSVAQRMGATIATPQKRRTGREGKSLETLVLASQSIVRLTKIPLSARRLPGGKVIACAGPVDFIGGFVDTKELIVFDAKQTDTKTRLETGKTHIHPHQREMIVRYGQAGFMAGLLCECTSTGFLYWCPWRLLATPRASIPWVEMLQIGTSKMAVDWKAIRHNYEDSWRLPAKGETP